MLTSALLCQFDLGLLETLDWLRRHLSSMMKHISTYIRLLGL